MRFFFGITLLTINIKIPAMVSLHFASLFHSCKEEYGMNTMTTTYIYGNGHAKHIYEK